MVRIWTFMHHLHTDVIKEASAHAEKASDGRRLREMWWWSFSKSSSIGIISFTLLTGRTFSLLCHLSRAALYRYFNPIRYFKAIGFIFQR